jgi:hypothetical protein
MRRILLLLVVLTIAVVLVIMCINSCNISTNLKKYVEQDEQRQTFEWQQAVVYDIIDKNSVQNEYKTGVSEAAIKKDYAGEAGKWTNASFSKDEIADSALKKALVDLTKSGVIRRVKDGYLSNPPKP